MTTKSTAPGRKAVALASGGIDSSTTMALAKKEGYELYALTFDYGQRHQYEVQAARQVVKALGAASHVVVKIDLRPFGGSALTSDIAIPKNRDLANMGAEIPVTYVPARNTIFLSIALGWCESLQAQDIFIGVNAVDYSGYPDCRPEFLESFQRLAKLATKAGVEGRAEYRIHAPLIHMTKGEIIRAGHAAGLDLSLTHSCYDPTADGFSCGACDACILRYKGFVDAGLPDPTRYVRGAPGTIRVS